MARNALLSEKRYETIMRRQAGAVRWCDEYQPAMRATRDEAPGRSRPSLAYWSKIGRDLHFMSLAERHVCLLALYHPGVFDVHEQHMLECGDAPHPLSQFPGSADPRVRASRTRGTVRIANELGMLSRHPAVRIQSPGDQEDATILPFPYLADLLIFLEDQRGRYAVNWSVKARREDFYERGRCVQSPLSPQAVGEVEQTLLSKRHMLEQMYFQELGIPTSFIASGELDVQLISNLNRLFARAQRKLRLSFAQEEELILKLQRMVEARQSVLSCLEQLTCELGCDRETVLDGFYKAVWERRVRIDLYRPVLVDKPLAPERTDVLADHLHLFQRA